MSYSVLRRSVRSEEVFEFLDMRRIQANDANFVVTLHRYHFTSCGIRISWPIASFQCATTESEAIEPGEDALAGESDVAALLPIQPAST